LAYDLHESVIGERREYLFNDRAAKAQAIRHLACGGCTGVVDYLESQVSEERLGQAQLRHRLWRTGQTRIAGQVRWLRAGGRGALQEIWRHGPSIGRRTFSRSRIVEW
jgi:hypothetical protein